MISDIVQIGFAPKDQRDKKLQSCLNFRFLKTQLYQHSIRVSVK